ncbi:hypothetical protein [Rhodoferax sp.]|uniref:hypothetical protein n=1 Tax=Rhodoferax sp. TaxID=50421 RepID=UPI00374CB92B
MLSSTAPQPVSTLQLQARQRTWQQLPRGTEIVVAEGAVRLHQREYLAGLWVDVPLLLRAGARHQVVAGGWVELEAVGVARVLVTERLVGRWLGFLVQRLALLTGRTSRPGI